MGSLWVLDCPCCRCLFDDPQKASIWRCNANTCPELTEWLITIADEEDDCEEMKSIKITPGRHPSFMVKDGFYDKVCLNCGETKPLLPNGLCQECATEMARSQKQS